MARRTLRNGMLLETGGATTVGYRRETQEDRSALVGAQNLYAVADGMGGHAHGELAAEMAIDALKSLVKPHELPFGEVSFCKVDQMRLGFEEANTSVYDAGKNEAMGMGTTLCALVLDEDEQQVIVGNVGDSRCYLLRHGKLRQITVDHSPMVGGQKTHFVTRAIGLSERVAVDLFAVPFSAGDVFLLCTDGITGPVDDKAIAAILTRPDEPRDLATALVNAALEGGGPDNATAIVIRLSRAVRPTKL